MVNLPLAITCTPSPLFPLCLTNASPAQSTPPSSAPTSFVGPAKDIHLHLPVMKSKSTVPIYLPGGRKRTEHTHQQIPTHKATVKTKRQQALSKMQSYHNQFRKEDGK
jgi:hypothetical protein